jgi:hypothetical protein
MHAKPGRIKHKKQLAVLQKESRRDTLRFVRNKAEQYYRVIISATPLRKV